jgi:serine/threonine-protein kinase
VFPGRTINEKYRIVRVLGRGGMGVVSEALCLETGKRYAIKFLREDVESDLQPTERFAREARLAKRLSSPHTCRLIDIDEWELGPFIVMELLDGRPLIAALIPGSPFKWQQAVRIAHEVCVALGEAHRLGIVHRDIKPANIFLAWASRQRAAVKVLDFGVAKVPANVLTASGGPSLTDAALLLGTPAYVAPEQLTNSKMVDARADVWALGVVMYEMLSGRLPFSSPLVPKLLLMIAREEPPALAEVAPHVPEALRQIVTRCLKKDPSARAPDADAVRVALESWLDPSEDLLAPLLRQASIRPLRLLSSQPPAEHLHEETTDAPSTLRTSTDSLGPHTTARIARPPRRYSRWQAIAGAAAVSFAAAILAVGIADRSPADAVRSAETEAARRTEGVLAEARDRPSTVVRVQPDEAVAVLELDGVTLPTNPYVVVEEDPRPGPEHVLRVRAPGFIPAERRFRAGELPEILVTLAPDRSTQQDSVRASTTPDRAASHDHSLSPRSVPDGSPAPSEADAATKPREAPSRDSLRQNGSRTGGVPTRLLDTQNPFQNP